MKKIKKNEENKIISLNKNDTNIIKDEEIFKVTPHFLNDNKTSCESLKEESVLKRPIVPSNGNNNRIRSPLTYEHTLLNNPTSLNVFLIINSILILKQKIME